MCGLAGAWHRNGGSAPELTALGLRMGAAIAHRGPDDAGAWAEPEAGLVLAHRRLSILDLSPEGHQPMTSADGRWVIAFNGEIYNHRALRQELQLLGHRFRGHSDTEVLLAALAQWGVEAALARGNGMLALAAWDRQQRVLWLARDRVGKKPLYYGRASDGSLVFGSELAALRLHAASKAATTRPLLRWTHCCAGCADVPGVARTAALVRRRGPSTYHWTGETDSSTIGLKPARPPLLALAGHAQGA